MRQLIKQTYLTIIRILNVIFFLNRIKPQHIVIMMTFPEDVLPIIRELDQRGYRLSVIAKPKDRALLTPFKQVTYVPAGNKQVFKQMKVLSTASVIIIDTYYLVLGGFHKKKGQTVIQTWHAAGALKYFGLKDHQVDLNNPRMVKQYRSVYDTTDYYLVGGEPMATCFREAFEVNDDHILRIGLPRLVPYCEMDVMAEQQRLKATYGIAGPLAIYVPTYREHQQANRAIDPEQLHETLPEFTIINKRHPAVADQAQTKISLQELMTMADLIITDYSSLAIEASLLNKPVLFYVYDEAEYDRERGLNRYYQAIPEQYKAYDTAQLFEQLTHFNHHRHQWKPLFKDWHTYNSRHSLAQLIAFIERITVK